MLIGEVAMAIFLFLTTGGALFLGALWLGTLPGRRSISSRPHDTVVSLRVRADALSDKNAAAEHLLTRAGLDDAPYSALQKRLSRIFPDLPARLTPDIGVLRYRAEIDGAQLTLTLRPVEDAVALDLRSEGLGPRHLTELFQRGAQIETLEEQFDATPHPVWHLTEEGEVSRANSAYRALQRSCGELAPFAALTANGTPQALEIDGTKHWFKLEEVETQGSRIRFALPADAEVSADRVKKNFIQTLAKTFAQLSTGLAIFDSHRQLVLFNPALVDLTTLPADFLSARPDMFSFFDHLRDINMLPEPKDYANWRKQLSTIMSEAEKGTFEETWTLPAGTTYRVTGRPHPDGAIAFLIKDISTEISLTRKFRAELDLSQSILDAMGHPIAVFSPVGRLIFYNESLQAFWSDDAAQAEHELNQATIETVTDRLRRATAPTPTWDRLRNFSYKKSERTPWSATVALDDGRIAKCHTSSLHRGMTLLRLEWRKAQPDRSALSKIIEHPIQNTRAPRELSYKTEDALPPPRISGVQ